jgi:hyperosmotically inducible protein
MDSIHSKRIHKAFIAASALALGLAACDQKPSAEKIGRSIDSAVDQAGQKAAAAVDSAETRIDQAKSAVAEKTEKAGAVLADAAITAKVKTALGTEPGLQSMGIDVVTEKGVVSLFGTTDSDANRKRVTQLAAAVEGVSSVDNRLVVIQGS